MAIKSVLQSDNPELFLPCLPVKDTTGLSSLIANLTDTMRSLGLIAIAAPQIGVHKQVFITEIRKTPRRDPENVDQLRVFVNPRIISISKDTTKVHEGCGSVNGIGRFGAVKRPNEIWVEALDQNLQSFKLRCNGLLARAIQHEIDHINGLLFTDSMPSNEPMISENEYISKFKDLETPLSKVTIKEFSQKTLD